MHQRIDGPRLTTKVPRWLDKLLAGEARRYGIPKSAVMRQVLVEWGERIRGPA